MSVVSFKRLWCYYAITSVLITVFFMLRSTDIRAVGLADVYGLNGIALVLVIAATSIIAFYMGFKNIYL